MYCNIAWGNAPYSIISPLARLQKIAIRLILSVRRRERITPKFIELKILKIQDLYTLSVAIFMQKYASLSLPVIFNNFYTTASTIHTHETRNVSKYRPPIYKTNPGNKFIKKTGIPIWNEICIQTGNATLGIGSIKKMVIEKFMKEYSEQ